MDRQRDWRLDPRLAEDFANREERANNHNQELLARQGDIEERGINRMGNVLSEGLDKGYQAFRQGRSDAIGKDFDKIKYDRLRAEDEYWNGPWDGGTLRAMGTVTSGNGASVPGGSVVPNQGTIRQGVSTSSRDGDMGLSEDDRPRTVTLKPEQSFSPGAVAVLEGRAHPGVNPAIRAQQNPTTDYLGGQIDTAQYLGLNRPMPTPQSGTNTSPATNSGGEAPAAMGAGAGLGTADGGQIVSRETRYDGDPNKTRLQHKWDLGLMKSEEEINQLRRGKTGNERVPTWKDTGKFDANGHPIMFNQLTGEYATAPDITGAKPVDKGAATDYQKGLLELGKEKNAIARGKPAPGQKPQLITTTDENGNSIQEFVVPKSGAKYPGKPAPTKAPKDLTSQERNSAMFYNNADEALKRLEGMETQGFRPTAGTAAKGMLPESMQGYAYSDDEQKYIQAAEDFTAAKLRLESGAAIPLSEIKQQSRIYMVRPGDSEAVIKQKQDSRKAALEGLKFKAGRGADQIKAQMAGSSATPNDNKRPEDMTPQERAAELKRLRGQ